MSGSIGASRIPTYKVMNTVSNYRTQVLTAMPGFVQVCPTGSFVKYYNTNTDKPNGHGDIDLVVHIEPKKGETLPELKKRFMRLCEILDDSVTVPFMSGNNKGKKVQMYGDVVTVQYPIIHEEGEEPEYVQIDNMIVTGEREYYFMQQFLSLPAIEQSLLIASLRVVPQDNIIEVFHELNLQDYLPQKHIDDNQRLEIVLGTRQWSLRLVTLDTDKKEIKSEQKTLYTNSNWNVLKFINRYFYLYNLSYITDFSHDYKYMTEYIYNKYKDYSNKEEYFTRIIGMIESIVTVKPGEVGTTKDYEKTNGISYIKNYLLRQY